MAVGKAQRRIARGGEAEKAVSPVVNGQDAFFERALMVSCKDENQNPRQAHRTKTLADGRRNALANGVNPFIVRQTGA